MSLFVLLVGIMLAFSWEASRDARVLQAYWCSALGLALRCLHDGSPYIGFLTLRGLPVAQRHVCRCAIVAMPWNLLLAAWVAARRAVGFGKGATR